MSESFVPIVAGGASAPGIVQAKMQGLLNVIPPQFPDGCELLICRPNSVKVLGRIMVPVGALILYVDPESAEQLRPAMEKQIEEAKRAAAAAARQSGVGPVRR